MPQTCLSREKKGKIIFYPLPNPKGNMLSITFDEVSNIIVDRSNTNLAADIWARLLSSFRSLCLSPIISQFEYNVKEKVFMSHHFLFPIFISFLRHISIFIFFLVFSFPSRTRENEHDKASTNNHVHFSFAFFLVKANDFLLSLFFLLSTLGELLSLCVCTEKHTAAVRKRWKKRKTIYSKWDY